MTAFHWSSYLADDLAVLDLDQQRVLYDAGVVDKHIERPEVTDDRIHRGDDLRFVGDVAAVGARLGTGGQAARARLLEVGGIEIDQRELGAARRELERHRAAESASAARDGDRLALDLHRHSPLPPLAVVAVRRERLATRAPRGPAQRSGAGLWHCQKNTGNPSRAQHVSASCSAKKVRENA